MARAAVELLQPGRWARASEAATADARARFATADVVARYEAIYEEALADVGARATPPMAGARD
jgi:hypothetical protein